MNDTTPNGKYIIKRPIRISCKECGFVSTPKYQMEINHGNYTYSDDSLTLCDNCMSIGWTDDPKAVYEAISKDPELSKLINRISPYF